MLAAIAASTAEPPARSASMAIRLASGWAVAAAPFAPQTAERVANGAPVTRSPLWIWERSVVMGIVIAADSPPLFPAKAGTQAFSRERGPRRQSRITTNLTNDTNSFGWRPRGCRCLFVRFVDAAADEQGGEDAERQHQDHQPGGHRFVAIGGGQLVAGVGLAEIEGRGGDRHQRPQSADGGGALVGAGDGHRLAAGELVQFDLVLIDHVAEVRLVGARDRGLQGRRDRRDAGLVLDHRPDAQRAAALNVDRLPFGRRRLGADSAGRPTSASRWLRPRRASTRPAARPCSSRR